MTYFASGQGGGKSNHRSSPPNIKKVLDIPVLSILLNTILVLWVFNEG